MQVDNGKRKRQSLRKVYYTQTRIRAMKHEGRRMMLLSVFKALAPYLGADYFA